MNMITVFKNLLISGLMLVAVCLFYSCAAPGEKVGVPVEDESVIKTSEDIPADSEASIDDIIMGGKLYDKWWIEVSGVEEPRYDHPLWSQQKTNKREGSATWRCKECHGWDYFGKDGAYGKGSHKTGFPGVYQVRDMPVKDIESILLGSTNANHNFSNVLDYDSIYRLAVFLKYGLVDEKEFIDYENKKPFRADIENGKMMFNKECTKCHGEDGTQLDFGIDNRPEYIGTVAYKNPWEFIHKVRFGQPGTIMPALRIKLKLTEEEKRMPSGIETGHDMEEIMDILGYSKTLPIK
jgi:thiosulfate dehydrogenase